LKPEDAVGGGDTADDDEVPTLNAPEPDLSPVGSVSPDAEMRALPERGGGRSEEFRYFPEEEDEGGAPLLVVVVVIVPPIEPW